MGYSFYYLPKNKFLVARNAKFLKNSLINQEASGSLKDLEIIQKEDMHPFVDTSLNHKEDYLEIDEPQSDIIPIRRSTRTRCPTDRMCLYIDAEEHELGDLSEPANYKVALLDPESDKWLNAMNVEMQSMKDNEVWVLVELPPNGKTVGSKWLFKKKTDMDGAVHTYKARLVVKDYTQTPGIDYEETFSPVADIRSIRILIAIVAYYDYEIWQMDVKTAFLNGYLNEEVYLEQPEGFVNKKYPNRVCKLKRSIYGLKQASRQWNKRFDDEIKKFGFSKNVDEPCVYLKASGSNVTFLILGWRHLNCVTFLFLLSMTLMALHSETRKRGGKQLILNVTIWRCESRTGNANEYSFVLLSTIELTLESTNAEKLYPSAPLLTSSGFLIFSCLMYSPSTIDARDQIAFHFPATFSWQKKPSFDLSPSRQVVYDSSDVVADVLHGFLLSTDDAELDNVDFCIRKIKSFTEKSEYWRDTNALSLVRNYAELVLYLFVLESINHQKKRKKGKGKEWGKEKKRKSKGSVGLHVLEMHERKRKLIMSHVLKLEEKEKELV
ncbi:retrotransposon protein, putative, ty1-copia subclass [Tanacetum coccineum]